MSEQPENGVEPGSVDAEGQEEVHADAPDDAGEDDSGEG